MSPFKGQTGLKRILNAAGYSLDGLRTAFYGEAAFRQLVLLNLLLIPHYGGEGAAMATLISYAMASYAALLVHSKTRPVFFMMTKSFFSPFRYAVSAVGAMR